MKRLALSFIVVLSVIVCFSTSALAVEDGLGTNVVRNLRVVPVGTLSLGNTAITNWTLLPVGTGAVSLVDYLATNAVFTSATGALNTRVTDLAVATNNLYNATNALNTRVTDLAVATNNLYNATNALNTAVINLNANTTRWDNAMVIREGTAGEAIAYSNLCYYKSSDSRWWKANATTNTTAQGMLGLALGTASAGGEPIPSAGLLINGYCTNAWGFTAGSIIYMDTNNGALTQSMPTGTNNIVRIMGYAISTTNIYFNPDRTYIEILGQE